MSNFDSQKHTVVCAECGDRRPAEMHAVNRHEIQVEVPPFCRKCDATRQQLLRTAKTSTTPHACCGAFPDVSDIDGLLWYVYCPRCHDGTHAKPTRAEAIELWNRIEERNGGAR